MNRYKYIFSSSFTAAIFLMATSAIGPGFLTQTAVFTQQLGASFGFVIFISILLDLGAQLNIWRIVSVSGLRVQEIGDRLVPGAGLFLTILVVAGGLAFNIGNLAGAGLGLQVLTGVSVEVGAVLSGLIAIIIFLSRDMLKWLDGFAKILGIIMIALTLYVVWQSSPPFLDAAYRTVMPEKIDSKAILTLVGGTVGGYISFAGAHRLLEGFDAGKSDLRAVTRSATSAILLTSLMRILLFLAALGVVASGFSLGADNPAAAVFQLASGDTGYKIFGIVMWSAAITSVTGSAYTSFSFLRTVHPSLEKLQKIFLVVFVVISALVFIWVGRPVKTLVAVGAFNSLVLPVGLTIILLSAYRRKVIGNYRQPWWLTASGVAVVLATLWMAFSALRLLGI